MTVSISVNRLVQPVCHTGATNEAMLTSGGLVYSKVKTGKSIGQSAWDRSLIEELGAEYLTMNVSMPRAGTHPPLDTKFHDGQHADLVETLHRLALSAGAHVTFGAVVESVDPAPEAPPQNGTSTSIAGPSSRTLRPSVRLKSGEILHADVILGADGPQGVVRRVVTGEPDQEAVPTGLSVYTGSVPMSEIRRHAPLRQLADGWLVWVGGKRVVFGASDFVPIRYVGTRWRAIIFPYCILIDPGLQVIP